MATIPGRRYDDSEEPGATSIVGYEAHVDSS